MNNKTAALATFWMLFIVCAVTPQSRKGLRRTELWRPIEEGLTLSYSEHETFVVERQSDASGSKEIAGDYQIFPPKSIMKNTFSLSPYMVAPLCISNRLSPGKLSLVRIVSSWHHINELNCVAECIYQ